MGFHHKLETVLWSKPSDDPKERKLVRKLDIVILTYVSRPSTLTTMLTTPGLPVVLQQLPRPGQSRQCCSIFMTMYELC